VECLAEGIILGDYRFLKYKNEDSENPSYPGLKRLAFAAEEKAGGLKKAAKRGANAAFATRCARDMAHEPGNGWTAAHFADYAEKLAEKYSLKCKIIDKAKMKRLGMGGLLAVNQGSAEPPKLVILEYSPEKASETLLLVGKGLTFDSGGISLKQAAGMQDMKYDMCGGAAVLAAMQAIAEEKPNLRVVAMIPATDNMSGSSALKPGDVIRHFNGITSEVVNTDAEGRLIIADALAFGVKEYKPDCIIDVATLTGAMVIGLGHHYTGILGNDDDLVDQLVNAGKKCGEPLWRLPLGKEYAKQIESQVADIKNAGGREGGAITAAAYLEKFVDAIPWAHLDIAGTAWDFTEKTYIPKGPSGIAVRTLVQFVRDRKGKK
jgi:leucyl aminopeptidase